MLCAKVTRTESATEKCRTRNKHVKREEPASAVPSYMESADSKLDQNFHAGLDYAYRGTPAVSCHAPAEPGPPYFHGQSPLALAPPPHLSASWAFLQFHDEAQ